jgi:hypothetical protein
MYKRLYGSLGKSYIHSFVSQHLLIGKAKVKAGQKDLSLEDAWRWYSPYFGVSDFRLREQCKELVQDPQYKAQTGNVIYPIDFHNVDRVRRYKNSEQLKADRPKTGKVNGHWINYWDLEHLTDYEGGEVDITVKRFLNAMGAWGHDVAFSTMYHDFTYDEIKVPREVLEQIDYMGALGPGRLPIPKVSEWTNNKKQFNRRGHTRHH